MVHGNREIGLINPGGERTLDRFMAQDMIVCSVFFARRESEGVLC